MVLLEPCYTDEHTSTEQFGVDNFEVLLSIESPDELIKNCAIRPSLLTT